ncbi:MULTISPECIES: YnbE family lipoprotein [Sneathiella]|jgi:hypothetical protein|uniref:YnbE family lipoprotein n=1 Tax=Sneathiella TaxID=510690 RepID=UPI001C6652B7|nr:YnbE family lipoprotein [Sneathiella aquimaris]
MSKGKSVERSKLAALSMTAIGLMVVLQACTPTVKVQAPSEPITINLNIKLDAEVRLKIEENAKSDIKNNPEIF